MEYFYFAGKEKIRLVELPTIAVGIRTEAGESELTELESTEFPSVRLPRYHTVFAAESARLASIAASPEARYATKVFCEPQTNKRLVLTDEIVVRFKSNVSENDMTAFATQFHLQQVKKSRFVNEQRVFRLKNSPVTEMKTLQVANELNAIDDVLFSQPNFLFEFQKLCQESSYFRQQWHLRNIEQNGGLMREDVAAKEAWDITTGKADIVVAVIDDGVNIEHPALRSNIWTNPNPKSDLDDQNGYNFYDDDNNPRPRYFQSPYNRITGNDIHGTPCAGLIASVDVNDAGVLGVAHGCKILPVKIWGADDLAPSADVAEAIRYAGIHADVLSCSWSCTPDADIHQALIDVQQQGRDGKGCPVFCATGNNWLTPVTPISYPARYKEAIAVGASTNLGFRADYSQYGEEIDFVAPSSGGTMAIFTTDVSIEHRGFNIGQGNAGDPNGLYTNNFGGTSAATPIAAGIAALMLSVNPDLTGEQVRQTMRDTAEKIDRQNGRYDENGFSQFYGYGRLSAYKAVREAIIHRQLGQAQEL